METVFCGAKISVRKHPEMTKERRWAYFYKITLPNGNVHTGNDLYSGCFCEAPSCKEMYGTLLGFLGAAVESYEYRISRNIGLDDKTRDDNLDLFPLEVVEWANQNYDEITMVAFDIEESLRKE